MCLLKVCSKYFSAAFYISVVYIVTPQFTTELVNRTVTVNGMITFSCEASGDPNPTIMWYRNQILISGKLNYNKEQKHKFRSVCFINIVDYCIRVKCYNSLFL